MLVLSDKHLKRIDIHPDVLLLCEQFNLALAGGALRGIFGKGETIEDYDLFFMTKSVTSDIGQMSLFMEELGYRQIFVCPEGKLSTYKKDDIKIQFIKNRVYYGAKSLLDSFDITACRIAYFEGKLFSFRNTIRDIRGKKVNLHRVTYPSATFKRIVKYHDKGYRITYDCIKSFLNLSKDIPESMDRFYID